MKLLRSERISARFGKNLPTIGFEMWYVFNFSLKIVVIRVQSKRIEAVRCYRYIAAGVQSCGSSNERVCNRSVRTTLTTEPSCVCLIEMKTESIFER